MFTTAIASGDNDATDPNYAAFLRQTALNLILLLGYEHVSRTKIQTIKILRDMTNCGLKEAKDTVESAINFGAGMQARDFKTADTAHRYAERMVDNWTKIIERLDEERRTLMERARGSIILFNSEAGGEDFRKITARRSTSTGLWLATGYADNFTWAELCDNFPQVARGEFSVIFDADNPF